LGIAIVPAIRNLKPASFLITKVHVG